MSKALKAGLMVSPVLIVVMTVFLYLALCNYYKGGFSFNTWVNDLYCTGKSIAEINEELTIKYETRPLTIINPDGTEEYIIPDEINFRVDFSKYLEEIVGTQNPYLWFKGFNSSSDELSIEPDIYFDEEELRRKVSMLSFVAKYSNEPAEPIDIILGDEGYCYYEYKPTVIDFEMAFDAIKTALYTDDSLKFDDSYLIYPTYSEKDLRIKKEWEAVKDYFIPKITYDMGTEKIVIDNKILSSFVTQKSDKTFKRNADGSLLLDEDKIRDYVENLCSSYDTYGKDRYFKTKDGRIKKIEHVYYGTLLDHKKESDYLVNAIKENISEVHVPTYKRRGYVRGFDDIGPTYIEVDMGKQVLYYFENSELIMKTDIVSGKMDEDNTTPQMICAIYNMQEDAILRGEDYESPVKYWMAIHGGIGLHDASWQTRYGGDWYIRHGSHGCINMKLKAVSELYKRVELGVPVILYY